MSSKANRLKSEIKSEKKEAKKSRSFFGWLRPVIDFFKKEKTHQIIGLMLMLGSIYLLVALTSFLFTGSVDQDKFNDQSVFSFLFGKNIQVENWLGKIGAVTSYLFIHKWFGVSSLIFVPLFFLLGYKVLFNVSLVPLRKTFIYSAFAILWLSSALAFAFRTNNYFLGGGFGFHINQWFYGLIGLIGLGFLLGFALIVFIVTSVDLSFLNQQKDIEDPLVSNENSEESAKDISLEFGNSEELEEQISQPQVEEKEIEVVDTAIEVASILPTMDELFETPAKPTKEKNKAEHESEDLTLDIEVPVEETVVSEDNIKAPEEQYDPTLELSSYKFPTIDLLEQYGSNKIQVNKEELEANKNRIVETLGHYNIDIDKIKAIIGPTVTLYEIIPAAGVRISKIKNLEDDIALSLAALGIRIIAPIPGKGTIGIEVPNQKPEVVSMSSIISSEKFQNTDFDLPIGLGKTISNDVFIADLAKMPHLLMAGATGQGKSVGLNAVLVSLLYKKHPSQIKFVLVDPKKVELTLFKKIERHFLAKLPGEGEAIITDTTKVVHTLNSLCQEMDLRYDLLKEAEVRNIKEYNTKFLARKLLPTKGHRYLPYIVLVVDEFADLIMTAGKEIETPIARLAQLARAIGIHLIIATQRPSVNIITGTIKANFPARIAFRVTSKIDSRTILDSGGADQLIGRGDMLLSTGADLIRLQCAFVDTPEVEKITEFIGSQRGYPEAHLLPEYVDDKVESGGVMDDSDRDQLFEEAARMVVQHQQGSASLLQRRLKLGYNRAGRIIDQLEAAGIIGPFEGSKAREVLVKDNAGLDNILGKNKPE